MTKPQPKPARRNEVESWLPSRALIGMVHLPPLPGSPRSALSIEGIAQRAVAEATLLAEAGFHAVIVENYGDAPFHADGVPPVTIAAMAVITERVRRAIGRPVGVNVLRNDARAALGIAAAAGAAFIRVNVLCGVYATDQGIVSGRADEVLRERARLCPAVRIAADVHVKHAVPMSQPDIALAAQDTAARGLADALIVSGAATGAPTKPDEVAIVKEAVRSRPIWVGSGVTPATATALLRIADALIVGTCLKEGGRTDAPLDPQRVRGFVRQVRMRG
jgi:membrane complex biogenesis BtpA family protein